MAEVKNKGGNPAWVKGCKPTNPKGARAVQEFKAALRFQLLKPADAEFNLKSKNLKRIDVIAMRLVRMGMEGDLGAIQEIANRLDGKPMTQVTMTDQDGKAVTGIRIEFYDPEPRDD